MQLEVHHDEFHRSDKWIKEIFFSFSRHLSFITNSFMHFLETFFILCNLLRNKKILSTDEVYGV